MRVIVTGGEAPPNKSNSDMQVMAMRSAGKMWPIIKPMTLGTIYYYRAGHIAGEVTLAMKSKMDIDEADGFEGADVVFTVYPTPSDIIKEIIESGARMIQI